jgi:hypothetical protein
MALGSGLARFAPFGVSRYGGGRAGPAKACPQHALVNDQLDYVRTVTHSDRAAELVVTPQTRSYLLRETPKTAPRIAGGDGAADAGDPFGTGPLGHQYTLRRVRETLLARSRYFRSVAQKKAAAS